MDLILKGILSAASRPQLEAHMEIMADLMPDPGSLEFLELYELGLSMIECDFKRVIH